MCCGLPALLEAQAVGDVTVTHGPFLGDVQDGHARVWLRVADAGQQPTIRVWEPDGTLAASATVTAQRAPRDGGIVHWKIDGLAPGVRYRYEVVDAAGGRVEGHRGGFIDMPMAAMPGSARGATIAIGSCADEDEGTQAILAEVERWHPDAVLLLGDTPYIDSVDAAVQMRRHGEFLAMPALQSLVRDRPLLAIWDDHDFGLNDTDGRMKGKEVARECFLAWHANPSAGHDDQGAYFSFRAGPMEVFVLDTRWFARTAHSSRSPQEWTLLGDRQWEWLEAGLRTSTARWKVVASSMVFNSAVRPFKTDFWMMYPSEYRRLLETIGSMPVPGVVLVSGDVHNSRVLRHPSASVAGYDLVEIVSSPMHERAHDSATWSPSTWVTASYPRPNMMALLSGSEDAHGAELRVRFVDVTGEVFHDEVLDRAGPTAAAAPPVPAHASATPIPWDAVAAEWVTAPAERAQTLRAISESRAWLESPKGVRECTKERCDPVLVRNDLAALEAWLVEPSAESPSLPPPPLAMWPIHGGQSIHLTGYATPRVTGAVGSVEPPSPNTWWPLVARPEEIAHGEPGPPRVDGMRQLRIPVAWVGDQLDGYLAEVNGSVQVQCADGGTICLVNDGTNELSYASLGRAMIREGLLSPDAATLASLRAVWQREPDAVRRLMLDNPRHVYWRAVPCDAFPPSATGPVLVPFHSVAIDPAIAPPGAPAVLQATIGGIPRTFLVVCTDRGGAIRGPARCDLYCGIGAEAMELAGEISGQAQLWLLGPSDPPARAE